MTTKELSAKQARWAKELARFDFEIEYKPEAENPADSPSRRPDYAQGLYVGEQRALRDAILPTLQQKLQIQMIQTSRAPSVTQETQGREPSNVGPRGPRQPSETPAPDNKCTKIASE
jgi:hypothetical protein